VTIHAVILAGGLGSRLGHVRKADLLIGGQRLINRVADRLEAVNGALLVSTGSHRGTQLPKSAVGVPDREMESQGPLAGIAAAADYLREVGSAHDSLVSVAVDSPFLPEDYFARMTAGLERAAYAAFGADFYPTNAHWPLGALWDALGKHEPDAGPRAILSALDGRRVDWSPMLSENPFASLNSLSDLIGLQMRARQA
jgi:molybdopterin-guanine dinucleotide biosynthesis protein A